MTRRETVRHAIWRGLQGPFPFQNRSRPASVSPGQRPPAPAPRPPWASPPRPAPPARPAPARPRPAPVRRRPSWLSRPPPGPQPRLHFVRRRAPQASAAANSASVFGLRRRILQRLGRSFLGRGAVEHRQRDTVPAPRQMNFSPKHTPRCCAGLLDRERLLNLHPVEEKCHLRPLLQNRPLRSISPDPAKHNRRPPAGRSWKNFPARIENSPIGIARRWPPPAPGTPAAGGATTATGALAGMVPSTVVASHRCKGGGTNRIAQDRLVDRQPSRREVFFHQDRASESTSPLCRIHSPRHRRETNRPDGDRSQQITNRVVVFGPVEPTQGHPSGIDRARRIAGQIDSQPMTTGAASASVGCGSSLGGILCLERF